MSTIKQKVFNKMFDVLTSEIYCSDSYFVTFNRWSHLFSENPDLVDISRKKLLNLYTSKEKEAKEFIRVAKKEQEEANEVLDILNQTKYKDIFKYHDFGARGQSEILSYMQEKAVPNNLGAQLFNIGLGMIALGEYIEKYTAEEVDKIIQHPISSNISSFVQVYHKAGPDDNSGKLSYLKLEKEERPAGIVMKAYNKKSYTDTLEKKLKKFLRCTDKLELFPFDDRITDPAWIAVLMRNAFDKPAIFNTFDSREMDCLNKNIASQSSKSDIKPAFLDIYLLNNGVHTVGTKKLHLLNIIKSYIHNRHFNITDIPVDEWMDFLPNPSHIKQGQMAFAISPNSSSSLILCNQMLSLPRKQEAKRKIKDFAELLTKQFSPAYCDYVFCETIKKIDVQDINEAVFHNATYIVEKIVKGKNSKEDLSHFINQYLIDNMTKFSNIVNGTFDDFKNLVEAFKKLQVVIDKTVLTPTAKKEFKKIRTL